MTTELKTKTKTRVIVGIIAGLMLLSSVAVYVAIIIANNKDKNSVSDELSEELLAAYEEKGKAYDAKVTEFNDSTLSLRNDNLESLIALRSEVKAFNAASANEGGLKKTDITAGTGRTIDANSVDYGLFYIGFCPDESVFDSSFDNFSAPSSLKSPLVVTSTDLLIPGMYQGLDGMSLGGSRVITIPGELAYGDTRDDLCDGANTPLKFIVKPVELSAESLKLGQEMNDLALEAQELYYKYFVNVYGAN